MIMPTFLTLFLLGVGGGGGLYYKWNWSEAVKILWIYLNTLALGLKSDFLLWKAYEFLKICNYFGDSQSRALELFNDVLFVIFGDQTLDLEGGRVKLNPTQRSWFSSTLARESPLRPALLMSLHGTLFIHLSWLIFLFFRIDFKTWVQEPFIKWNAHFTTIPVKPFFWLIIWKVYMVIF